MSFFFGSRRRGRSIRPNAAYALYSFKSSFGYKFPHYMMAASTMMMIPTLIIFFLAQNAFMRGVVVTGVKG
jgi:multiple sugar transport system permease protein